MEETLHYFEPGARPIQACCRITYELERTRGDSAHLLVRLHHALEARLRQGRTRARCPLSCEIARANRPSARVPPRTWAWPPPRTPPSIGAKCQLPRGTSVMVRYMHSRGQRSTLAKELPDAAVAHYGTDVIRRGNHRAMPSRPGRGDPRPTMGGVPSVHRCDQ